MTEFGAIWDPLGLLEMAIHHKGFLLTAWACAAGLRVSVTLLLPFCLRVACRVWGGFLARYFLRVRRPTRNNIYIPPLIQPQGQEVRE